VHSTGGRGQAIWQALGGRAQETDVEAGVVGDQHRAAGELQERRQHRVDGGRVAHHRRGDAGERDDLRRDAAPRIDQGGQLAQHRAAAHLDRPDLGDRVVALAGARPPVVSRSTTTKVVSAQ
jgi:hypothetical protein